MSSNQSDNKNVLDRARDFVHETVHNAAQSEEEKLEEDADKTFPQKSGSAVEATLKSVIASAEKVKAQAEVKAEEAEKYTGEVAGGARDKVGEMTIGARDKVGEIAGGARDKVGEVAGGARDKVGEVAGGVADKFNGNDKP
jgi:hypothetical protein